MLGRSWAASGEGASGRRVERVGQLAVLLFGCGERSAHHRRAVGEELCIGVLRALENPFGPADFHHRAEVEDDNPVTHGLDDGQIVTDEQIGQIEPVLEISEQVQHLSLNRDIERRDRLVQNNDARVGGQCTRNTDPLRLATREFVRVPVEELFAQIYGIEDLALSILCRRFSGASIIWRTVLRGLRLLIGS